MATGTGFIRPLSRKNMIVFPFGIGLVVGAVAAWLWMLLTPAGVPIEEYTALVGAAYARERLPANAIDRLKSTGVTDVEATVAGIAAKYRRQHPDRVRDANNLDQLALALMAPASSKGSAGPNWLGWLIGFVAVLVSVAVVYLWRRGARGEAVSVERLGDPQPGTMGDGACGRRALAGAPVTPAAERVAPRISRSQDATNVTVTPQPGARTRALTRHFLCTYHAGEEPFEDVHTIQCDDDKLVGACGLTASAKLESGNPTRYYAFTAWVHDYLSGEPMTAVGLLSPWASGRKRLALYDPALTRAKLHRAEKGLTATMETRNLFVQATVNDLGYGMARDVPANSYFTILSVKFVVTINRE